MLDSRREKLESGARKANDKFTRAAERESEFLRDRQKNRDAEDAKASRLRTLRLAKEAADKETEALQGAEKGVTKAKRTVSRAAAKAAVSSG
jgi:uncharacterized protein (DUF885 family)